MQQAQRDQKAPATCLQVPQGSPGGLLERELDADLVRVAQPVVAVIQAPGAGGGRQRRQGHAAGRVRTRSRQRRRLPSACALSTSSHQTQQVGGCPAAALILPQQPLSNLSSPPPLQLLPEHRPQRACAAVCEVVPRQLHGAGQHVAARAAADAHLLARLVRLLQHLDL